MWRITVLSVMLLVAVAAACSSSTDDTVDDPQAVVESYFAAWNTRNVDDIMELIADDASVEVNQVGVLLTDRAEIRADFEEMFSRSEWTIEVSDFRVEDQTVTYNFVILGPDGGQLDSGRSQATVQDGKITAERMIGPFEEPQP